MVLGLCQDNTLARCGGQLKIIASIEEPQLIAKILSHLERAAPEQYQSELPLGARGPPLQPSAGDRPAIFGIAAGGTLESTEYGTKYAIIGPLTGLNGRVAEILTVWIILAGEDVLRFVTAYPKD
jgi:hypothetical protein